MYSEPMVIVFLLHFLVHEALPGTGSLNLSSTRFYKNRVNSTLAINFIIRHARRKCGLDSVGDLLPGDQIAFDSSGAMRLANTTFELSGGNAFVNAGSRVGVQASAMGELTFDEDTTGYSPSKC